MRIEVFLRKGMASFPVVDDVLNRGEAERLLCRALGVSRLDLYIERDRELTQDEEASARSLFHRRADGEPIQYILGEAHFRNLTLAVGPGVLIPRPETELLAGEAIRIAAGVQCAAGDSLWVLDVGTGSGAVALSVAAETPGGRVVGVDISPAALAYAVRNATAAGCRNVDFIQGDLCGSFMPCSFDIVTANLPYVTEDEYACLPVEVAAFEPRTALLAGRDGLDVIRRLVVDALRTLRPGGWLLLEIGAAQAEAVGALLRLNGAYQEPEVLRDFCGRDRVVMAKKS